jgi:phage terminase large subunit-like protein
VFDESKANRAIRFFERVLRHTKGRFAGKDFLLLPWQHQVISDIFGTVDDDGNRVFQTGYIEVPKKNGKSELAAGIALFALVADNEPGAEVYSAAAAKDQASLVFKVAASMVEHSPVLSSKLQVIRSTKTIVKRGDPDSFYRAIAADGDLQDGINPHCVIADELHRWKVSKALDLWEILERGTIARSQPLVFAITTAGIPDESPLCWRYHEYTRRLNDSASGFSDKHFYGRIWGAEDSDDWTDPAVWIKANPSHEANGGFLRSSALEKEYERAKNNPGEQPEFKRYHLNVWGQRENRWMDMQAWDACNADLRPLVDRTCYLGVDLSYTTDLTAVVAVFPSDDGTYDVLPWFFMPRERMRRAELRDKVPYALWERQGFLTATEGDVIDYAAVNKRIDDCREMFSVAEVDFDPWNANQFIALLVDAGCLCVKVPQTYGHLSAPTKHFMDLVLSKKIRHAGHPVLRWNAECAAVKGDGKDNVMLTKPDRVKSAKRIDGMSAAINALSRAMVMSGAEASILVI